MYGFNYIIGHEAVAARLKRALSGEKVNHAYILSGEKGIGKKTIANAFAKALNCESNDKQARVSGDCNCISCRVFESGNHPDTLYVKGTNIKSVGVEDVREQMLRPVNIRTFKYKYQIFIMDMAETLTPQAQNTLLKTIEEPAPYRVFLLLAAHTHTLLPTILSRCVVLKLKPLADDAVIQALTAKGISEEEAAFSAAFAQGNIGRALLNAGSEDFKAMRGLSAEVASGIGKMDINSAMALFHRFEKWKDSIQSLLDMLYLCYHEMLKKTTPEIPMAALFRNLDALTQTKKALRYNGNFQLNIEILLLTLSGKLEYT